MSIRHEYPKGEEEIYPNHRFVNNWKFSKGEEAEAMFADAFAVLMEKNGFSVNDVYQLFPAMLRITNSDVAWAGKPKGRNKSFPIDKPSQTDILFK